MQIVFLIPEYLVWHYSKALRLHLNIITNFVWFTYHFFSVPVLYKTLTQPWYGQSMFIYQIIGPVIRFPVLLFGLIFCGTVAVVGFVFFLIWLVLPVAVLVLLFQAVRILIP
jgi:hypothetical protein